MKDFFKRYKLYIMIGIATLILLVGTTFAYYIWKSSTNAVVSANICTPIVLFDGGSDITGTDILPVLSKENGTIKEISVSKSGICTKSVSMNLYLELTTFPTELADSSFKYELYKNSSTTSVASGNFASKKQGDIITLLSNTTVLSTEDTYKLYIYIDDNVDNPMEMANKSFSFKLYATGQGAISASTYTLTNGDGSTYTPTYSGSGTKAVRSTAPLSTFKEVRVDNTVVSSSNYTLSEGSTIITFKETYLKSLSAGDHSLKIISTDGFTSGTITVKKITAGEYITNLYNNVSKELVRNNNIFYAIAPSISLMSDRLGTSNGEEYERAEDYAGGNIRYYGASPNNYIYFNCSDYFNQSSSTCEIWRIIGVFDGKVKIIRNESIGKLAWDYDKNIDSSKTTYNNNWSTASLQVLLNGSYYNGVGTVTYYSGFDSDPAAPLTTSLNMASIGIKNSTTRNMIAETTWYLGGLENTTIFSDQAYTYERGTIVYTGNPTTWTGKIGLMYPSDYGYASDFNKCYFQIGEYDSSCYEYNNWLYNENYLATWTLTPSSTSSDTAVHNADGRLVEIITSQSGNILPTLYLSNELSIASGDGSSSNPYKLSV